MSNFYLLLLLSCLFLDATLHETGRKGRKRSRKKNISAFPVPRTFKGMLRVKTHSFFIGNGTQASPTVLPTMEDAPPPLWLLSNSTAEYLRGPLSTRVFPSIYVLLVAVGIPTNAAILYVTATKARKLSSAILYCSLALSDLFLLLSLIVKAYYHFHGNNWVLGEAACRAVTACFYGNLYCSAQTLACISVKRYLAVVHPFKYKRLPQKAFSTGASVAVWAVFGAAMLPELLIQQSYYLPQLGLITCHDVLPLDDSVYLIYYNVVLTFFGLLLPLVVTAVCHGRIVKELNSSHRDWALYIEASTLMFVIFLLCFAPAGILHFLHYVRLFVDGQQSFYVYFKVAACLCCLHSCLDPFLLLAMTRTTHSMLNYTAFKGHLVKISGISNISLEYQTASL